MADTVSVFAISATIVLLVLVVYAIFQLMRVGEKSTEFRSGKTLEDFKRILRLGSDSNLQKPAPKLELPMIVVIIIPLPLLIQFAGNTFLCILALIAVFFVSMIFVSIRVKGILAVFEAHYINPEGWRDLESGRDRTWRIRKRRVWRWDILHYELSRNPLAKNFSEFKKLVLNACEGDDRLECTRDMKHHAQKDILAVYESEYLKQKGLSAQVIFDELKGIKGFELWTDRFRYYAHIGKDIPYIKTWIKRCFDLRIDVPIALVAAASFFTVGSFRLGLDLVFLLLSSFYFGCAFLFGLVAILLSILCANVGVASVIELEVPLASREFGDPIYSKLGYSTLLLSAFSAIILGVGMPLLISDFHWALITAMFVACFLVGIFLVSMIGLNKGMAESKERKLSEIRQRIYTERNSSRIKRYLDEYDEVERMRVWPINTRIVSRLAAYAIVPIAMNFKTDIWGLIVQAFQRLLP